MYEFSPEHLERLSAKLSFKYAVRDHVLHTINQSDDKYKTELEKTPLLDKINLDIEELEESIAMLQDFFG
jgi:hypothetical protein